MGERKRDGGRDKTCVIERLSVREERPPDPSVSERPRQGCLLFYQCRPGALGRESD